MEPKQEAQLEIKVVFKVVIPYSRHKKFEIALLKRMKEEKKEYTLSLMTLRRLIDIPGYEDEWGLGWMEFITLWRNFRKNERGKPSI